MSVAGFEDFANTVSARPGGAPRAQSRRFTRMTVLGGGQDARMIAALGLAEGVEVTLFSAYGAELAELKAAGSVTLRGDGPIGSFAVDQTRGPSIRTTAALDEATGGAEVIVLTGPVQKQRTYAMVLADHLADGQVLVLPEARSLGAVEIAWLLRAGGCRADVTVVEMAGLPFWCRQDRGQLHLSACPPRPAATLPSGREAVIAALSPVFPGTEPVLSTVQSGFADASAAVEIPALLIGGPAAPDGAPKVPEGALPLPENATFAHLLGPTQRALTTRLWAERQAVALAFGVRALPEVDTVIARIAGAPRGSGSRPVPDRATAQALIQAGVVASLLPLVSAADLAGTDVPVTRATITLAMAALGRDLRGIGRSLGTIGITATTVADARRQFDAIIAGEFHG
jgi:opine dehydrogenase